MIQKRDDRRLAVQLAIIFAAFLVALIRQRTRHNGQTIGTRSIRRSSVSTPDPELIRTELPENTAGFRLLVTILAGVALGAATSALPTLMTTSAKGQLLVSIWLFWTTGVIAVVLVYLSTLTGSKVIPNEIGFAHTTALIASFLAQCGLFTSLIRPDPQESVRWWLASFSAFGAAATTAILLGLWLLPKSHRKMNEEALKVYRKGQQGDAIMAGLTASVPFIYVVSTPSSSDCAALIASSVALISILGACLKQSMERKLLRRNGLI